MAIHLAALSWALIFILRLLYMISENTQMLRYFDIKRLDTNLSTYLSN